MKINKQWHLDNPMPKNPTFNQRVEWHLQHQKNCACRPIPAKLASAMIEQGIKL
ncbi:hypothetical protein [Mucilaginibacter ginsenosidivorax]|uniref:hypothetical protein n=1 Tax=Mucilaginibacter ginsenosidivorax TaxID=862126 RepID=UPI0018653A7A|nr:hypothetical protein [Mucilaginibacter ginsenosidivorax]